MGQQRGVGAVGEAGVHGPGLVGAVEHFVEHVVDALGQALAAEFRIAGQCRPAGFNVLRVGFLEALGRGDGAADLVEMAAFLVAGMVERVSHVLGELGRFFCDRVDRVDVEVGMLRQGFELLVNAKKLVQDKLHITQGGDVLAHKTLQKAQKRDGCSVASTKKASKATPSG